MSDNPTDRELELMTQLVACLKKEKDRAIFTTIGIALSAFARMEEGMITVAANLLRIPPEKAGLVFYSIINFQTWLAIIGQLFAEDQAFGHLAPQWNKLSERIRALKDDRDRFAHHSAIGDDLNGVLSRSRWDVRSKSMAQQPLDTDGVYKTIEKINHRVTELTNLIQAMTEIAKSLPGKGALPTEDQNLHTDSQ